MTAQDLFDAIIKYDEARANLKRHLQGMRSLLVQLSASTAAARARLAAGVLGPQKKDQLDIAMNGMRALGMIRLNEEDFMAPFNKLLANIHHVPDVLLEAAPANGHNNKT